MGSYAVMGMVFVIKILMIVNPHWGSSVDNPALTVFATPLPDGGKWQLKVSSTLLF